MKKIITILLIIISVFSFFILFNREKQKSVNNMEKVEETLSNSHKIILPQMSANKDQTIVYNKLVGILKQHKANIYFTRMGDNDKIIKFVYLTNLSYFDNYRLVTGRFFNLNELETDKFISSQHTKNSNQIGRIETFDGKINFEINTLGTMIKDKYSLNGDCVVQLDPDDNIDLFINDLEKALNFEGVQEISKDNVTFDYNYNRWVLPALYFMIALLILYSIIKSYKKYGVQLMLGYSPKSVWLSQVLTFLFIQGLIFILVDILMSAFLFKEVNSYFISFLKQLFYDNIKKEIILFIVSSIPFIYLYNIKIGSMLKNKLPIKDILIFNSAIKIILTLLLFSIIGQGMRNYDRIRNVFEENYTKWADTKGYYIIPWAIGDYDIIELENEEVPLYHTINKEGAIMADFYLYSPGQRKMRISETKYDYERDQVTVNPNYLKKNTVYDIDNKPINISEQETDFILLVPDKYKKDEISIIDYFKKVKKQYGENSIVATQDIKIIYTKSDQKLFSYERDIYPNDGNYVADPIVRVVTDNNATYHEYGRIIGFTGNPIKIKADSSSNPEEYIKGKLREVNLDKYVDKISSVNEEMASEIKFVQGLIAFIFGGLIILTLAMLVIIVQNVACYFEDYKKHIAIRQLHGFKTIHKYFEYFLLLIPSWIIIIGINAYIGGASIKVQSALIILFIFIELLITILVMGFVNKRKIVSVIKGS